MKDEVLIRNEHGRKVRVPKALYENKKDRNDWERLDLERSYKELRDKAVKAGVYKVGMTTKDLKEALEDVGED